MGTGWGGSCVRPKGPSPFSSRDLHLFLNEYPQDPTRVGQVPGSPVPVSDTPDKYYKEVVVMSLEV